SRQSVYLSHFPDGTSTHTIAHYSQIASGNEIRHFQKGLLGDFTTLDTVLYNYSNIDVPIYVFWSRNDWVTPRDEIHKAVLPRLRTGVVRATIEVPHYNHLDFIVATDNSEHVYSVITEIIGGRE
ncbi:hypothetical protein PMAYCL1PPCAC_16626, partial [Pristionchus mayeri]